MFCKTNYEIIHYKARFIIMIVKLFDKEKSKLLDIRQ